LIFSKQKYWLERTKLVFKQGLTPRQLALSITIGSVVGIMPFFGISTAIVAGLAIYLRLNIPIAIFMTYAVSPFHVLLFIPFIKLGEKIFGVRETLMSIDAIKDAFKADYLAALNNLTLEIVYGLVAWVIIAGPLTLILYGILYAVFNILDKTKNTSH
jgi:uncharacterized protein (DUF2062 family)